jgi:hypothetical protein
MRLYNERASDGGGGGSQLHAFVSSLFNYLKYAIGKSKLFIRDMPADRLENRFSAIQGISTGCQELPIVYDFIIINSFQVA